MNKIEAEWEDFAKKVLPANCHPIQRQEMRRAFYAGAWSMLNVVKAIGDDTVSEDAGVFTLEMLQSECIEFNEGVLAGRN